MYQVKLSQKQADTYYFIKAFIKEQGYPPTLAEIAEAHSITITAANFRLSHLIEKCAVTRKMNHARSIKLVPRFKVVIKEKK